MKKDIEKILWEHHDESCLDVIKATEELTTYIKQREREAVEEFIEWDEKEALGSLYNQESGPSPLKLRFEQYLQERNKDE